MGCTAQDPRHRTAATLRRRLDRQVSSDHVGNRSFFRNRIRDEITAQPVTAGCLAREFAISAEYTFFPVGNDLQLRVSHDEQSAVSFSWLVSPMCPFWQFSTNCKNAGYLCYLWESKPIAVPARTRPSHTPMLASADDTVRLSLSHHVQLVPGCLGHNYGHGRRTGGQSRGLTADHPIYSSAPLSGVPSSSGCAGCAPHLARHAPAWMWEAHTDGISQPHRRRIRRTAACTAPATSPAPAGVRAV